MNPPTQNLIPVPGKDGESPAPSLRSVAGKSALLNVVIVLTSAPVLIRAGGPKAVGVIVEIMVGITVVIWIATFALFSLVTFPRLFRTPVSRVKPTDILDPEKETGVANRWLNGSA